MRAIVVSELGGPEVRVAAAGVNFIDIYQRSGIGAYTQRTPYTPGGEGAGTVLAVGDGVTDFAAGDGVAWSTGQGSYAEQAVLPARSAVPVPRGIDLKIAAAVMLQGMTAHYLTH